MKASIELIKRSNAVLMSRKNLDNIKRYSDSLSKDDINRLLKEAFEKLKT